MDSVVDRTLHLTLTEHDAELLLPVLDHVLRNHELPGMPRDQAELMNVLHAAVRRFVAASA